MKRIGVVVPTLFSRSDYLRQSLEAIQKAGKAYVILMGPNVEQNSKDYKGLFDQLIEEPKTGTLSAKLSFALSSFPENIDLITWIGDDDLLATGSLDFLQILFEDDPFIDLAYGSCDYVDSSGRKIGKNKSGSWAIGLAKFGPFLAPQPGSLFRRAVFQTLGGLDETLKLAFDYDFFLRVGAKGKTRYVRRTLASFRWHPNSLSVSKRIDSVREAKRVREKNSSGIGKLVVFAVNPVIIALTLAAGYWTNIRCNIKSLDQ